MRAKCHEGTALRGKGEDRSMRRGSRRRGRGGGSGDRWGGDDREDTQRERGEGPLSGRTRERARRRGRGVWSGERVGGNDRMRREFS